MIQAMGTPPTMIIRKLSEAKPTCARYDQRRAGRRGGEQRFGGRHSHRGQLQDLLGATERQLPSFTSVDADVAALDSLLIGVRACPPAVR